MSTPPMNNLYTQFLRRAEVSPQKTLIVVDDEPIRYDDFVTETERIARQLLRAGATPGDKVGIILPNSRLWYTVFWAAVRIGLQPVPFDPQIGSWEMSRLLGLTEVKICFAAVQYRHNRILENLLVARREVPGPVQIIVVDAEPDDERDNNTTGQADVCTFEAFMTGPPPATTVPPVVEVDDAGCLMLACTSGSTGSPKIIVVPHRGFYKAQQDMADYLGFGPEDVMLLGMPLYHQGGFGMGLQMVLGGGTVFYQSRFDPAAFLSMVEHNRISVLQLTPTVAKIILSVPDFARYDLSSVRLVYFAGEMLPWEVARVFRESIGARVVNIIGSTETATMVVWDSDVCDDHEVNTFGALPFTAVKVMNAGQEVAVGETGSIMIHTDALLIEYLKNSDETARRLFWMDGKRWFDTGDLGQRCEGDRVRFSGRAKRAIKRGGNLVCPEEIESFLLTHPDIEAVAVTSEPHELIGEMVVAHIQPRQNCRFTRRDMIRFCTGQLAGYKIPDKTVVTSSIPKDIGKVQFKYMRQR